MSEVITETILPGTYIEVRAEGLLGVPSFATGNVGIIGLAERGSAALTRLSSFDGAKAAFGEAGDWEPSARDDNLSLVRSLDLVFGNGARTVFALRVLDESDAPTAARAATLNVTGEGGGTLVLRAKTPGTWGNRLSLRVEAADAPERVLGERVERANGTLRLSATQLASASPDTPLGAVVVRSADVIERLPIRGGTGAGAVAVNLSTRALTFPAEPANDAEIVADYLVPAAGLRRVTLRFGGAQEVYVVPSLSYLAQRLTDADQPSKLVEVVRRDGDGVPQPVPQFTPFANGANGVVTDAHYQAALDRLVNEDVQIVLVAGRGFSRVKGALLAHVEKAENVGRERIAIVGADDGDVDTVLANAAAVANKRLVLVAPGLRQNDADTAGTITLPPAYAAAAVAGKLSGLAPHVSLTNKDVAGIDALATDYDYGRLTALVQARVLALAVQRGIRVVKGISTDDEAFRQISVRRIVDYVKQGTRLGANQYIGKLNNRRVRENLRTTLDGFLSSCLRDELLTGFKLDVFADRPMEIRGEVGVVMDLNPTFSIDVVRVTMNLS